MLLSKFDQKNNDKRALDQCEKYKHSLKSLIKITYDQFEIKIMSIYVFEM